jgi:protein-S-isoprenylcysteine O-methyltransferase Ste14
MTKEAHSLITKAILRFIAGMGILSLAVFLSAGSIRYWHGWVYIVTFIILMLLSFTWLHRHDKALLERRLHSREREDEQRVFVILSSVLTIAIYVVPGLDYRYGWSSVSLFVVLPAEVLFVVSYLLFFRVMQENSYASRVVEVQEDQKVIDTGMYRIVRHPMYMAMSLFYISTPLVLGSYAGLIPAILFPIVLSLRIKNEEKVLEERLKGYREYKERVRYRMIPYIW